MVKRKLSFFNRLVYSLTLLVTILLIAASGIQYISFGKVTVFSVLSLAVPVMKVGCIFFLFFWILKRNRLWIFVFGALVFSYFTLGPFIKWRGSNTEVDKRDLSVMTFNVMNFNSNEMIADDTMGDRALKFVLDSEPDILCMQEFDYSKIRSDDFENYPYSYIDFVFGAYTQKVIQAIYSKYPIINKQNLNFPKSSNNGIYADVVVNEDTVRVYNIHLQSLKIRPDNLTKENSNRLYTRLGESFSKQEEQAKIVSDNIKNCEYKKILCGDFNNTQFSNIYKEIKGDFKDTFLEAGSGIGRTFLFARLPLRIDFIMVDESIEVKTHHNYDEVLSDHFPVMATLDISSNK